MPSGPDDQLPTLSKVIANDPMVIGSQGFLYNICGILAKVRKSENTIVFKTVLYLSECTILNYIYNL